MSEQAKRAYEAYVRANTKGANPHHDVPWEKLLSQTREAWRAAIVAAVDSPPREEKLTDVQMRLLDEMGAVDIANKLKAMLPPDRGFILFTINYGDNGTLVYAATIDRDDSVRTVREWLKHQGAL
jgi:hypothetical protein